MLQLILIVLVVLVAAVVISLIVKAQRKSMASVVVNPAKPQRIISVKEANSLLTRKEKKEFWETKYRWKLNISVDQLSFLKKLSLSLKMIFGKKVEISGADWIAQSPFGNVRETIILGTDGKPVFDRPVYHEAPNGNYGVYAYDKSGKPLIAVIEQARPHSFNPFDEDDVNAPVFGQIAMGFEDKLLGKKALEEYEHNESRREIKEELGNPLILKKEIPNLARLNPSPSFVETWSDLVFFEIDPKSLNRDDLDISEGIRKAELVPIDELYRRIKAGKHNGAIYRYGNALAMWALMLACHPEWAKYIK